MSSFSSARFLESYTNLPTAIFMIVLQYLSPGLCGPLQRTPSLCWKIPAMIRKALERYYCAFTQYSELFFYAFGITPGTEPQAVRLVAPLS